jgi:hypothetical protein
VQARGHQRSIMGNGLVPVVFLLSVSTLLQIAPPCAAAAPKLIPLEVLRARPGQYFTQARESGVAGADIPSMSPVFLGYPENSRVDKKMAAADLQSLAETVRLIRENGTRARQIKQSLAAEKRPRQALHSISAEDMRDWQGFTIGLQFLLRQNKCGSVYNKESATFAICCLFKVSGAADNVFSCVSRRRSRQTCSSPDPCTPSAT